MLSPILERIASVPPFKGAISFNDVPDGAFRMRLGEEANFAIPHTFKIENVHGEICISCFEWPSAENGEDPEGNGQLELVIREMDGVWTAVNPEGIEFTEDQLDYALNIMDIFLNKQ